MVDPVFGLNDFGKPKLLTENQTFVNNFMLLLLGKPGFYPSIPNIGIDISQYLYGFEDEIDIQALKKKIAAQCTDFLPAINNGEFDITKTTLNNKTLLVFVLPSINDTKNSIVSLGVTTNEKGEVIFKFVENKKQYI